MTPHAYCWIIGMGMTSIESHHFFDDGLNENSVVVDLGAYKGAFSREMEERYACNIYAVEASPYSYAHTYSSSHVQKFNYAVCGSCEPIKFFIADNPEGNSIYEAHRDAAEAFVETPGITLPAFMDVHHLQHIDVLKVDIEGAEIDLIRSMSDGDLQNIQQITMECHDFIKELEIAEAVEAMKSRLKSLGFRCIIFQYPNKDVLFINQRNNPVAAWSMYTQQAAAKFKLYKRTVAILLKSGNNN